MVLLVLVVAAAVSTCEPEYPVYRPPPSIAWDGSSYLVAWTRPMRRGYAVFVQHFTSDGRAIGARSEVFRDPDLSGRVYLVRVRDGFLVLMCRHDQTSERPVMEHDLVVLRLDGKGVPSGHRM
jgi:hypothetical protein